MTVIDLPNGKRIIVCCPPRMASRAVDEAFFRAAKRTQGVGTWRLFCQSCHDLSPYHYVPASLIRQQGVLVISPVREPRSWLRSMYRIFDNNFWERDRNVAYLDNLGKCTYEEFTKYLVDRFPDFYRDMLQRFIGSPPIRYPLRYELLRDDFLSTARQLNLDAKIDDLRRVDYTPLQFQLHRVLKETQEECDLVAKWAKVYRQYLDQ